MSIEYFGRVGEAEPMTDPKVSGRVRFTHSSIDRDIFSVMGTFLGTFDNVTDVGGFRREMHGCIYIWGSHLYSSPFFFALGTVFGTFDNVTEVAGFG